MQRKCAVRASDELEQVSVPELSEKLKAEYLAIVARTTPVADSRILRSDRTTCTLPAEAAC